MKTRRVVRVTDETLGIALDIPQPEMDAPARRIFNAALADMLVTAVRADLKVEAEAKALAGDTKARRPPQSAGPRRRDNAVHPPQVSPGR